MHRIITEEDFTELPVKTEDLIKVEHPIEEEKEEPATTVKRGRKGRDGQRHHKNPCGITEKGEKQ